MNNRVTSESGSAVSLFPFLAVLLCTMGALLVLLVVLAQRAGERVAGAPPAPVAPPAVAPPAPVDTTEADELRDKLAEVRAYQEQLDQLSKEAAERLRQEQERLAHVEDHNRRLEHELARLSLASEQLKATEADQSVDQQQAERELARLQQLIKDTEAEIDELREQPRSKQSYAIVPYKGTNGTYRKPIYIECSKDGITLHPEGIRLQPRDFVATSWAGNPLAAALRATRNHVNEQAALAGAPEPPDPYPMLLVRPDGIRQYGLARAAITSWDADFGYEFIDNDWQLTFPESADPRLAAVQQHAIMQSRDQLERLIRSAPRRFQGIGLAGSGGAGVGRSAAGLGYGAGESNGGGWGGDEEGGESLLANSQTGGTGTGGVGDSAMGESNGDPSETHYGDLAGDPTGEPASAGGDSTTGTAAGDQPQGQSGSGAEDTATGVTGDRYADAAGGAAGTGGTSSNQFGSGASGSAGSSASTQTASNGGQAAGGATSAGSGGAGGASAGSSGNTVSIAESHGRNWAVDGRSQGSVPIQRPIQVVVHKNRLTLLPNRHELGGSNARVQEISLDQPMQQVSSEFVTALRTRIDEWGIAGRGLYWKPVLRLNVNPDAGQTAARVVRLLQDSGVEVSLPQTARTPAGGLINAPQ